MHQSVLVSYIYNIHDLLLSFLLGISNRDFTFLDGTQKCILCILICYRNVKSFNVNSVFTKSMIGKSYCLYCVFLFMWNIEFTLFPSFFFTASHWQWGKSRGSTINHSKGTVPNSNSSIWIVVVPSLSLSVYFT